MARRGFRSGLVAGLTLGLVTGIFVGGVIVSAVGDILAPEAGASIPPGSEVSLGPRVVVTDAGAGAQASRDLEAYGGLGAWVDVFDFDPAYRDGSPPTVTPADVDLMADAGVETLYLQATRYDERSPAGVASPVLLAQFLERAHARDLRVVGWYLPELADVDGDLARVRTILDFEAFGHRFDGVALDIEDRSSVPDPTERNRRLVVLSEQVRELAGPTPVAAIVLPPVLTEVVNDQFWPGFPFRELAPLYDVWMPMSYWSGRTVDSGYRDGYVYNEESTRRLRENLGDAEAVVHAIGGIGDSISAVEIEDFVRSLVDTGAVGGSIYDWSTLPVEHRDQLRRAFTQGSAAELPDPPRS